MAEEVVLSARDLVSASVAALGGGDLAFANISVSIYLFRMRVSFLVPNANGDGAMQSVTAVGAESLNQEIAQESACVAALQTLQQEHGCLVLDYSLFRVWECHSRYVVLSEKLEQSKSLFYDVLRRALATFESVKEVGTFFISKINDLDGHDGVCSSARSCSAYLQAMYVQTMHEHRDRVERFEELNVHSDFVGLLASSGFNLPLAEGGLTRFEGGLNLTLDRVCEALMFDPPVITFSTLGAKFRYFVNLVSSDGNERRNFRPFGQISENREIARQTAIYRSLLACSVNHNVTIIDPNRAAYIFSKLRVDEVSSEIVLLGELGSCTCTRVQTMMRSIDVITSSYRHSLEVHPVGEVLVGKLQSMYSVLRERLRRISAKVRTLNENLLVAQLAF